MAKVTHRAKSTYTVELGKYEFSVIVRLLLLELKSGEAGPMPRHHLHLLVEKLRSAAGESQCVEEHWEDVFGGMMTIPDDAFS